jgi:hypothetical protein
MVQHEGSHVERGGVTIVQSDSVKDACCQRGVLAHVAPQKWRILRLFPITQLKAKKGKLEGKKREENGV